MLPARDGVGLAATLFDPETPNGAALLLNSGTGIPRQFYAAFAQHLAGRGFAVMTYDYRGVGGSQTSPSATVEQWGSIDQASMIDHLARLRPATSLGLIGHSFGGQVLGLADNVAKLDAALLICSQSGHWRHWPAGRRRLRMLALWWLLIPGLTAATGRFPGSWIGTANLPATIARMAPADLGVESIGHFGFFRKSMPRRPWDDIAGWFEGRLLGARHSGGASVAAE